MKTSILLLATLLQCSNAKAEQAIGVNTHGAYGQPIEIIADMGATWARVAFPWSLIESVQGDYDFTHTDRVLRDMKAQGIKVLFLLGSPPSFWSSNGQENGIPNRAAWTRFVDAMSTRYAEFVDAWEIHNEPNLKQFFVGTSRDYVESYLKPASLVLRKNTPAIPIAAPGVTHISQAKPGEYLKDIRKYNALNTFDIVSYHVYTVSRPRDLKDRLTKSSIGKTSVLKYLQDAGMANKGFFLTEFGCDEVETGSEVANANCLYEMSKILQGIPWVTGFFIYALADDPRDYQQVRWGLLRHDFTVKPAVPRLKSLFR